ncbi:6-bladed beta-propeller [Parabacteroides pacaensis]|uniref:6-bladed beta-propeller n=1 Tax=Parabacteroides pacaensis TaxID=2086575 RepID=UPI000D104BC8|nr:6-bladed beta-propeller [Parabacteroides pacaensis]
MKIYSITWSYLIFGFLFFLSCSGQGEKANEGILLFKKVNPDELNISLTSSIIKLETTDSCLMGDIVQIEKDDSTIFILDTYKKVYAFDCKGNFLNRIGVYGEASESYLSCPFFYLDKKNKVLSVVDNARSKVLNHSYNGKYLSSQEIQSPEDIKWCSKGMISDDGDLLVYRLMNPFDNFQYALFDAENSFACLWKNYSYDPIRLKDHAVDFSNRPMADTKEGIHFILPLCDTVFQFSQGNIIPAYRIELPLPMLPKQFFKEELTTRKSYFSMVNNLAGDKYFSGFTDIFETSTHLLLKYRDSYIASYYLADKKEQKGSFQQLKGGTDLKEIPLWDILSATEDEFISAISCETLLDWEEKVENKSSIHPDLKKILATSQFDDNPCLVFYRF